MVFSEEICKWKRWLDYSNNKVEIEWSMYDKTNM